MVEVRRTEVARPAKVPEGLDAVAHRWQGRWRGRRSTSARLWAAAARVEAVAEQLRDADEGELHRLVVHHRTELRRRGGGVLAPETVEAALPVLVELADRKLSLRPYRVQIMGALALTGGRLAEMGTGEGKTLTLALASAAAAWRGRPCHVVTANDYLAERDAVHLARYYAACGLRVAHVAAGFEPRPRREAYAADVVYCTSKELVADFLRDRLLLGRLTQAERRTIVNLVRKPGPEAPLVQRGLFTVLVDEADNQLIDEAVTPLIISQRREDAELVRCCREATRLAGGLEEGADYSLDHRHKDASLTVRGRERVAVAAPGAPGGLYGEAAWLTALVTLALQARHFFHRDKQYVVVDDQIVIVDEFTGRPMPGRAWRQGLHQAVEAKEGVPITAPTESLARLSFQRFFRLFRHLGGITGTAWEARDEFWGVYGLPAVKIPPHRPSRRRDLPGRYFPTAEAKWAAIVAAVLAEHRQERPVLIGTRSVAASELLAARLEAFGLRVAVLNAVRHREEAIIVAMAGEPGAVTIATNMAGRGTDIRLDPRVIERGGLHVLLTEHHEAGRIDRQLMGRAGRQGEPGSTQIFASLEDELALRFAPGWARRGAALALRANSSGAQRLAARFFRWLQRRAEKQAYRQRSQVLVQDRKLAATLLAEADVGLRDE